MEQDRELKYGLKKAAWILMSPKTQYDIQSDPAGDVLMYMRTEAGTPDLMIAGIPVKAVTWMPDDIVVVTPTYEDDPAVFFKEAWLDELWKGAKGSSVGESSLSDAVKEYKIRYDSTPWTATTSGTGSFLSDLGTITTSTTDALRITGDFKASTGFTLYASHPKEPSSSRAYTYEENPSAWDEPIVEYDPDPKSIYGKALARAKRAKK